MSLGNNLQKYTYPYLMARALERVPDTVDKREGSIIYDALAPACYLLAQFYNELWVLTQETYILTATGEHLENRTLEYGIGRGEATSAVKRGDFTDASGQPIAVPALSRWSTISTTIPIIYSVIGAYQNPENGHTVPGAYRMKCETLGTVGGEYTGNILPLSNLPAVAQAVLSATLIEGQNTESDTELRERYMDRVNFKSFGGNIAQYRELFIDQEGIGACQVYPVWNGGGTVKVSVIGSDRLPLEPESVDELQIKIDPEWELVTPSRGLGLVPIDHKCEVTTAHPRILPVESTVTVDPSYTLEELMPAISASIEAYFVKVRNAWGTPTTLNEYSLTVYIAQVIVAILSVEGVVNVTDTKLDEDVLDITLTETSALQEIPILGEVVLHNAI